MNKKTNVSIFVPHFGCPRKCTFCNQRSITGANGDVFKNAEETIETARRTLGENTKNAEIAFFGGSFTAIDRGFMLSLLNIAAPLVRSGEFGGIRISTRPDAIDEEILGILKENCVTAIELGAQSMSDKVLLMNKRGHDSDSVRESSRMIKKLGFELGLQMMTGMYGSDDETDLYTALELIKLRPDTVRIYPTVVIKDTELCELYESGEYKVSTLQNTVELCAKLLQTFENEGIRVIRLGLHSTLNEDGGCVAGAYHPALRELCEGEIYFKNACERLKGKEKGKWTLFVKKGCVSKMTNQGKKNIKRLYERGYDCVVKEDDSLEKYEIRECRNDIKIADNAGL